MGSQGQGWKNLERTVAKYLGGKRVLRGSDFSVKDVDVIIDDIPSLRIDAKYRTRHAHHTFMHEIMKKYCSHPDHEPVLVTKHHNQRSAFVTIRIEHYAFLLDVLRAFTDKEDK